MLSDGSLTRRIVLKSLASGVTTTSMLTPGRFLGLMASAGYEDWNETWDSAVLQGALLVMDKSFDPEAGLISGHVGPEYSYQSNLRSQKVHPTRTTMEYALYLLESKDNRRTETAVKILDRMEALQEKDPSSKWFGLWGWYVEEPPAQMPAADFNWADFNGALLLCMILRHRERLSPVVIQQISSMIGRCCISIRKRNVSMGYTNIACMGTFVTLAGSEVLEDAELHTYAVERLGRFAAFIDETGSFAEYNSPTYTKVLVQNLTRMLMFVKDAQALVLVRRIHERAWLHIAKHWHLPTRQIAAPMSRCYFNDLGLQIWIQKALNNELVFMGRKAISEGPPHENEDVALVAYRCPDNLKQYFTIAGGARMHREIFLLGSPADTTHASALEDVEGTSYLTPAFCIGSANRSDFWIQRRPLMAYWGPAQHPVLCLQMKVIKDDYDFSSGLFYSVQNHGAVLGQVRFRSDGGDRHISLDPIRDQTFKLSRMVVQLSFDVWEEGWKLFAGERDVTSQTVPLPTGSSLLVDAGTVQIAFRFLEPEFASYDPQLRFTKGGGKAMIELILMSAAQPVTLDWRDVKSAGCGIALFMTTGRRADLVASAVFEPGRFSTEGREELSVSRWQSPEGKLELVTARGVGTGDFMNRAFRSSIDNQPVLMQRLSDVPLAK
jgi:hypothetical protein